MQHPNFLQNTGEKRVDLGTAVCQAKVQAVCQLMIMHERLFKM